MALGGPSCEGDGGGAGGGAGAPKTWGGEADPAVPGPVGGYGWVGDSCDGGATLVEGTDLDEHVRYCALDGVLDGHWGRWYAPTVDWGPWERKRAGGT